MTQIGFDLEIGVERERRIVAVLEFAAEFPVQRRVGQISDVRAHARHRQPAPRIGAFGKIASAAPVRIGHHRLAADLVESDVLRRMPGGARDRQRGEDAPRIARRPLQHLHAAHRAADDGKQRVDAEMIEQHRLRAHHVADGDDGKVEAPGLAGRRIGRGRPGGAHAAADDVGADDEITVGVDRLAGPDHGLPPARLAGDRMVVDHVLVAGQRMADQDGVAALGIQRAVGLVGDLQWAEIDAGIEPQRLIHGKAHDQRMRIVRFARAVGEIERGAHFCHKCFPDRRFPAWRLRPRGGQRGVIRPLPAGVNVFFDFAANGTYQSRLSPG